MLLTLRMLRALVAYSSVDLVSSMSRPLAEMQAMNIVPEGASVTADRRSNALVVSGPDSLRQQVRALAGRLLARAACRAALKMGVGAGAISASPVGATSTATAAPALPPTSDDPLSPRVARTKGRKPYLSAPRPCRLAAPNWNFNGSHDGEGRGGEGERRRFGPDKVSCWRRSRS